eukprot:EG_transcript_6117
MVVVDQPEHASTVAWHVIEEFPHFEILRRRRIVRKESHGLMRAPLVAHEQQFRLRTKKGKSKYILAQSCAIAEIYSDLALLETAVGAADTAHWAMEDWGRVASTVRQLAAAEDTHVCLVKGNSFTVSPRPGKDCHTPRQEGTDGHVLDAHTGVEALSERYPSLGNASFGEASAYSGRSDSASDVHAELAGRLLHGVLAQLRGVRDVLRWRSAPVTAGCLGVVFGSWAVGLLLELLAVAVVWGLSRVVDQLPHTTDAEGAWAFRLTVDWLNRQTACLEHPSSSLPLFGRLLLVPTLVFILFKWLYPPGFRLFLLLLPFVAGAVLTYAPAFAPLVDPKAWLLIPHSSALPPATLTPRPAPTSAVPASTAPRPPGVPPLPLGPPALPNGLPAPPARLAEDPAASFVVCPPSAALVPRGGCAFNATVVRLVDLHLAEGWAHFKTQKTMVVDSKVVPWTDAKAFRLTTVFDCALEAMGAWLSGPDNLFKTDQLIEKRDVVQTVDDHTIVVHNFYRSPIMGVSKRDVVLQMTRAYLTPTQAQDLGLPAKRTFVDVSSSCTHPACPETSAYVRSKVYCGGYICQEEGPRRTAVVNIGLASPEGWIPARVVDSVGFKLTGKIEKLRQCVESSAA